MAITTAEELLQATEIGRCELVRGELRTMIPPSFEHGRVIMNLATPLDRHVRNQKLGVVVAAETGFVLSRDPDTVRAPDIAFLVTERSEGPAHGYYPGAPDLAVEVLSPDDRPGYVREKVAEWLEAGARAVWVVDPGTRTIELHGTASAPIRLEEGDELVGGELLPGFRIAVRAVFA
ncbi:MAG: Uma2 family endonuclease [Planctomycetota bacterium]